MVLVSAKEMIDKAHEGHYAIPAFNTNNLEWTKCETVEQYNAQYHENNDVCRQFAKDLDPETEIINRTVSEMSEEFYRWDSEGAKFSNKNFIAAVWDLYKIGIGVAKVAGKSRKVFMRQEDTNQMLKH